MFLSLVIAVLTTAWTSACKTSSLINHLAVNSVTVYSASPVFGEETIIYMSVYYCLHIYICRHNVYVHVSTLSIFFGDSLTK